MSGREKISIIFAEMLGTAILATIIIAAAGYFNFTSPWYTSLAAGLSLSVLVVLFGKISGAHLNPAVTIGLWSIKKIPTTTTIVYIASQLLGGLLALGFVEYVADKNILGQSVSSVDPRIFVAEMVGSAVFGLSVATVALKKLDGYIAAFTIGMGLMMGILVASISAPGFINPAVALANDTWDKTVVLAPVIGLIIGVNIYNLLFSSCPEMVTSQKTNRKKKRKSKP